VSGRSKSDLSVEHATAKPLYHAEKIEELETLTCSGQKFIV